MDPLSLTASVIAVAGAAQQVGKGLNVLKTAKDAPQGLDDLLSDVSRFEIVLEVVKNALSESVRDTPALTRVLSVAQGKLLEVNELVQYNLTIAGKNNKVDRWQWLRRGDEVGRLRTQLYGIQGDLTALISSNSLYVLSCSLHHLCYTNHLLPHGLSSRSYSSLTRVGTYSTTLQQLSITSQLSLREQQHIRQQINRQEAMLALLCARHEQSFLIPEGMAWPLRDGCPLHSRTNEAVARPSSTSFTVTVNNLDKRSSIQPKSGVRPSRCRPSCGCSCHRVQSLRVPRVGNFMICGVRFPGSRTICDIKSCEEPSPLSIRANFCPPAWVARQMLFILFTSSPLRGPELLLRVPRMASKESPIVQALNQGDLSSFKRIVAQGKASPYDVDEHGLPFTLVCIMVVRET